MTFLMEMMSQFTRVHFELERLRSGGLSAINSTASH